MSPSNRWTRVIELDPVPKQIVWHLTSEQRRPIMRRMERYPMAYVERNLAAPKRSQPPTKVP